MIALLRNNRIYYILTGLIIVAGFITLLLIPKGGLVLQFDANSSESLDTFFMMVTKVGEITGASIVFLILFFFADKKFRLIFPISVVLMLLISQGLKHQVYPEERRPVSTYKNLHEIEGLERHVLNSFPSGHTTAAFTYFTILALAFRQKTFRFLAPFLAALVGISRVYLGQHYLHDTVVGAILGIFTATIVTHCYHLFIQRYRV